MGAATASANSAGIQTAALIMGGSGQVDTEHYDGTSWTDGGNLNQHRFGGGAMGTQTDAVLAGGNHPPGDNLLTMSEQYNGTAWVTTASISTGRQYTSGSGSTTTGFIAGGATPLTGSNATEEFTAETTATRAVKTIDFD